MRALVFGFVMTAGMILFLTPSADAQVISRNNPYRSFNVSGVNYGSTQWEKQNRGKGVYKSTTPQRRVIRRWR